jgi:hypothetical protein
VFFSNQQFFREKFFASGNISIANSRDRKLAEFVINVDEKKSRPIQAIKVKQDDNKLETAQASALVFFYEKQ